MPRILKDLKGISQSLRRDWDPRFVIISPNLSAVHDLDLEMYIAVRDHDSSAHFTYRFPI